MSVSQKIDAWLGKWASPKLVVWLSPHCCCQGVRARNSARKRKNKSNQNNLYKNTKRIKEYRR